MMYATLFVCAVTFTYVTYRDPSARPGTTGVSVWAAHRQGIILLTLGLLGAIIAVNAHAIVMHRYLGKNMSWFATELSPLLLYGPSALAGKWSACTFSNAYSSFVRCFGFAGSAGRRLRAHNVHFALDLDVLRGPCSPISWHWIRSNFIHDSTAAVWRAAPRQARQRERQHRIFDHIRTRTNSTPCIGHRGHSDSLRRVRTSR